MTSGKSNVESNTNILSRNQEDDVNNMQFTTKISAAANKRSFPSLSFKYF